MGTKISAQTSASALDGTELLPVVQAASNVKATTQQVKDFVQKTSVTTQTGDYQPVLADASGYIRMNKATALAATLPSDATVAFPVGTFIEWEQMGAGALSFVAGAGATVLSRGADLVVFGQYSTAWSRKVAANTWLLGGDL